MTQELVDNSDGLIPTLPCCQSLHNNFPFKLLIFLFIILLDLADLISDWLLFKDVAVAEKGLVYGPPDDSIRLALLAFCVIGTQTISLELINLWRDIFRGNPWLDVELLSSVTVWLEDVPQIVINVIIIGCREEAISYFQLVKASVAIVGAIIRIIFSFVIYCSKQARDDIASVKNNHRSRIKVIYRILIISGLVVTLGGAALIFLFTQYERNPDGSLNFKMPHNYIQGKYEESKYFDNVSVYFTHEMFDSKIYLNKSAKHRNLLRLFDINDIRHMHEVDKIIKLEYNQINETSNVQSFILWESDSARTLHAKECFTVDRTREHITIGVNCSGYISGPKIHIMFKFHFIKPNDLKLIFGDIRYNIKVKHNSDNKCKPPDYEIRGDVIDDSENNVSTLHYYRTLSNFNKRHHVVHLSNNYGTFYDVDDLQDISDVWKTGFVYCKSTGRLAPHRDSSITIPCI